MFKLTLFGTPHLEGPLGIVPHAGPRRVALLASLAVAGPAGLTRDKLVARLWPDADDDRARRNLSQMLYAMRTELGTDLAEGTGTLRLDPARCWTDVSAFDVAIAEHRDRDALDLYRGPFLDGFHLSESADFSQWADLERERRGAAVLAAALRVATAASSSDFDIAKTAWLRVIALDPLSSRPVLRLFDMLVAHGDRASALRVADQYATRVRTELESEPDASVLDRAEALRRAPTASPREVATPASELRTSAGTAPYPSPSTITTPPGPALAPVPPRTDSWRVRRRTFAAGAGTIAVILALLAWSARTPATLRDGEFVLLAEFANHTADTLLTRTVGTAVAAALQQSAHVVPLPRGRMAAVLRRMERPDTTERIDVDLALEVAQREGVRLVLSGEVIASGADREIISRIIEARTGRILSARTFPFTADGNLLAAVDRLAAAMRRDLGEAASTVSDAVPLPDVTTPSLQALRHYADGLEALRRDDDGVAADFFEQAIAGDSNFASAHAQLGTHFSANNDIPRANHHFERALAQQKHLPFPELQRIQIAAASASGDLDRAVAISRGYLSSRPRDADAWARLGYYLYTAGQHAAARQVYRTAGDLSPLSAGSLLNIGTSWLGEARLSTTTVAFDSARHYYQRAIAMQPGLEYSAFFNHQYGTILLGAGQADSARATFARMMLREPLDRARGLRSSAFLSAMEGRWRRAADQFAEAAEISASRQQWTSASRNEALLADLLLLRGDDAGAAAPLRRATTIAMREPLEARAIAFVALAQVRAGNRAAANALLARIRAASRPEHDGEQSALLTVEGALDLAAGRAREARSTLQAAFRRDSLRLQTRLLLARALSAAGDDSAAVSLWTAMTSTFEFGVEGQFDWQLASYERARLLERMGRPEQAIEAYRNIIGRYPIDIADRDFPPLVAARRRLEILERGGR